MSKTLADLEKDKPEDIAKELEERAKAKEAGKSAAEIPEDKEPKDAPETPEGEAPAEGDAPKEPAPSGTGEHAELPPLLRRLKDEYGIDHSYADEEALLKSHANLRKKLSSRDEDARLGRALREAGVSPEDIAGLFKTGNEPARGRDDKGPPKWDPEWDRQIKRVENDGEVEYRGPPEMVRKFKEYEAELDSFRRDPVGTMLDKWGLRNRIDEAAETALRKRQGEEMFRAFMKENGDFIEENRDEIDALVREEGFTPLTAVKHLKVLKETEDFRKGKGTEDAKRADLERLKGKATKRAGAQGTPIKSVRELADMSTRDAIAAKLAESGQSIPESW